MATTAMISTAKLSVDDVFCSKRGSKLAKLVDDGHECIYMPDAFLRTPFAPTTFDKDPTATRLNLQLSIDDAAVEEQILAFDAWAVQYLTEHSERLFKKPMSREQVEAGYSSCLRSSSKEGFSPLLKVKLDTQGRHAVCYWDANGGAAEPPEEWREISVKPRLHLSHLWVMGTQFGFVIRITDARLSSADNRVATRSNPFK